MKNNLTRLTDMDEAIKHIALAVKLVGHTAAGRIVAELRTEARMQREYLLETGGWS